METTNKLYKYLEKKIKSCYSDLLFAKAHYFSEIHIEGFRSRLDELLLLYHQIWECSFLEACKDFNINYKDVNIITHNDTTKNKAKESQ